MPRLTIDQIAQLSQVSPATVSRVLNDFAHVRPEVRARVLKVIDESGYVPNASARSLARNRTHLLSVMVPTESSRLFSLGYFSTIIPAMVEHATERNYLVALSTVSSLDVERTYYQQVLQARRVDGAIFLTPHMDEPIIPFLVRDGIPFVMFGRHAYLKNITWIDVDNHAGGRMAAGHLLDLGYRRVGTMVVPVNEAWTIDRRDGYKQALVEHGIPLDDALMPTCSLNEADAYQTAMRLLRLSNRPDALFLPSESLLLGTLRAARELGLTVPDDLGIVGYDNAMPGNFGDLRITTIVQPTQEIAAAAIDMLIDRVENPDRPPLQRILPVTLVVRDSCGAALRAAHHERKEAEAPIIAYT